MIDVILTEDHGGYLTINDLQWFQDAVLSAGGRKGEAWHIQITDGSIRVSIPGSCEDEE
jgi:hypothetical protein